MYCHNILISTSSDSVSGKNAETIEPITAIKINFEPGIFLAAMSLMLPNSNKMKDINANNINIDVTLNPNFNSLIFIDSANSIYTD